MTKQKKLLFGENAYAVIKNAKLVNRLTNTSYDVAAQKADERIEQNNSEYAEIYKRAVLLLFMKGNKYDKYN